MSEDIYQLYLDEIEAIPPCDAAEQAALAVALANGDKQAKNRLVEGNLKTVMAYTKDYLGKGVTVNDLIQEANMALLMAVESYGALAASVMAERTGQEAHLAEGAFEQFLELKIKEALTAVVENQETEQKVEEKVLARVNVLKDISQRLAEELGREATVEELAEDMNRKVPIEYAQGNVMTADEIRDIMKLTLDAMSVTGDYEE